MLDALKRWYLAVLGHDLETPRVVEYVRRYANGDSAARIVDIGCGYGRTLRALRARGIDALGVEINASIAERNRRDGLRCVTPDEFQREAVQSDLMIMSHVVEHFPPEALVGFMDGYLDRLKAGGHLIVATPLLHPRFFDDFDHVKPYHPTGFAMVFGAGPAQVQYYARNRLELVDLWIRRSPLAVHFARGLYLKDPLTRGWQIVNLLGALLFRGSGGLLGRATGWVGAFRKTGSAP